MHTLIYQIKIREAFLLQNLMFKYSVKNSYEKTQGNDMPIDKIDLTNRFK